MYKAIKPSGCHALPAPNPRLFFEDGDGCRPVTAPRRYLRFPRPPWKSLPEPASLWSAATSPVPPSRSTGRAVTPSLPAKAADGLRCRGASSGADAAGPGATRPLPLTFPGDGEDVVAAGQRDAEVVILGEAAAVQHVGPGEAESGHDRGAAFLHLLAERVAGLDDLVQVVDADGSKEGAEELPGVGVALLLHQRDPGGRLLQHLLHRLMPQQVG